MCAEDVARPLVSAASRFLSTLFGAVQKPARIACHTSGRVGTGRGEKCRDESVSTLQTRVSAPLRHWRLEIHLRQFGLLANRLAPVGAGLFLLPQRHQGVTQVQ